MYSTLSLAISEDKFFCHIDSIVISDAFLSFEIPTST